MRPASIRRARPARACRLVPPTLAIRAPAPTGPPFSLTAWNRASSYSVRPSAVRVLTDLALPARAGRAPPRPLASAGAAASDGAAGAAALAAAPRRPPVAAPVLAALVAPAAAPRAAL